MSNFLQYVFSGVTTGAVYALVAVGLTLIYNTTDVINFAQGSFLVIGGFAAISLHSAGLPLLLAVVLATLIGAAFGVLLYRGVIRVARRASVMAIVMITLGIFTIVENGGLLIYGSSPHNFPAFIGGGPIHIGGAVLEVQTLVAFGVTMLLGIALWAFYRFTMTGQGMLACAIQPEGAALVGIPVALMITLSFALSAGLGALGGTLIAPVTGIQYSMGFGIAVKAFAAAVLGGLGNVAGAIGGGIILGLLEAFAAGYGSSAYSDVVSYGLILLVLIALPSGLFGGRAEGRSHTAAGSAQ
jgi:branched-chain amino acid transport system permease protein